MQRLRHTIPCQIDGYEDLELTFDLSMTDAEMRAVRDTTDLCAPLVDSPNWEAVAADLGLPAAKPAFPLSVEALGDLPVVLLRYLATDAALNDALTDYMDQRHPFYRRR